MFRVAILYIPALSCISMIFCSTPLILPEPWQSCCTQEVSSFELGSPSHTRPELLKGLLCVLRRPLQEPLPWVWIRHCAQRDSPWGPWPKWKGSGNMRAWTLCCVVGSLNWASQKIQEHMDLVCYTGFISVLLDLSLALDISNQQPTDRYMRPHAAQSCYERGPTNLLKTLSIFVWFFFLTLLWYCQE